MMTYSIDLSPLSSMSFHYCFSIFLHEILPFFDAYSRADMQKCPLAASKCSGAVITVALYMAEMMLWRFTMVGKADGLRRGALQFRRCKSDGQRGRMLADAGRR